MLATARAHSNIALIKYWGKRDTALNLPAVGSISLTLEALSTTTTVRFDPELRADALLLNGQAAADDDKGLVRVRGFLDLLRARSGKKLFAEVTSRNDFPTGAGLASSASGFAALTAAASCALALDLSPAEMSIFARQGSGSAARSIFGGFVEMRHGERADGSDAYATPLLGPADWPLKLVVAVTDTRPKTLGSTSGMERTRDTSPYYAGWVDAQETDLAAARAAITARDFSRLGELTEHSCMKMHGLMLSARPPILYWNPTTLACIHAVWELRRKGVEAYCTIDAGPQLKVLCTQEGAPRVEAALREVNGVQQLLVSGLGPGVHVT